MPLEFRKHITRQMLQSEPEALFVFGDNLARWGLGGQAAEMRGEPNAIGLPTKRSPTEYLSDEDRARVADAAFRNLWRLRRHLQRGGTVIWPTDGIGTGLADLAQRAPKVRLFYDLVLKSLQQTAETKS